MAGDSYYTKMLNKLLSKPGVVVPKETEDDRIMRLRDERDAAKDAMKAKVKADVVIKAPIVEDAAIPEPEEKIERQPYFKPNWFTGDGKKSK